MSSRLSQFNKLAYANNICLNLDKKETICLYLDSLSQRRLKETDSIEFTLTECNTESYGIHAKLFLLWYPVRIGEI